MTIKDSKIKSLFFENIKDRLLLEYTYSSVPFVLTDNMDCYNHYKKFFCRWNFPKCDMATDETLPLCLDSCTEFHNVCSLKEDNCLIVYPTVAIANRNESFRNQIG